MSTDSAKAAMQSHDTQVEQIAAQIRRHYERGEQFRINHGSTNSTRTSGKSGHIIDISKLNRVLEVNRETKTALVEPNVPMDRLVEATMEHGLLPPIVIDFPGITVGGGYAGTSGESSSFRHGFFDRTLNWAEIVLGNSDIVRASDTQHADLFHSAAGAVGSLGTTTLVELRLVEAKTYVEVTYHPVSSIETAIASIEQSAGNPDVDYVDGIMFSPTHGAVITGRLTSSPSPSAPVRTFSRAWDPWFYMHASSLTESTTIPTTETVPVAEYLFRYDRAGFWVGRLAFKYFSPVPFNRWTRWFLDDFLHTRMMYTALHHGGNAIPELFVQDLALPYETAPEFVRYVEQDLGIWPLWLCPLMTPAGKSFHPHLLGAGGATTTTSEGNMLNIGVWGFAPKAPKGEDQFAHQVKVNRDMEGKLQELGGMKWLYAKTFYPQNEFWDVYAEPEPRKSDGGSAGSMEASDQWYRQLREKYHATHLPSVYDKVRTDVGAQRQRQQHWSERLKSIWLLGGLWGIWKAIQSRTYLEARRSKWREWSEEGRKQKTS